jgi:hypothetical protein
MRRAGTNNAPMLNLAEFGKDNIMIVKPLTIVMLPF